MMFLTTTRSSQLRILFFGKCVCDIGTMTKGICTLITGIHMTYQPQCLERQMEVLNKDIFNKVD